MRNQPASMTCELPQLLAGAALAGLALLLAFAATFLVTQSSTSCAPKDRDYGAGWAATPWRAIAAR